MSAAVVSAVVAGAAVVVSGVMQYLTLRRAHEDTRLSLEASQHTTWVTALASATELWEQGLREDLAEFATFTYEIESDYKWAMSHNEPWPGEKFDAVIKLDVLYNRILLRLDQDVAEQKRLKEAMRSLMDSKADGLWITRRDVVVAAAVAAFRARWASVLSEPTPGPGLRTERPAPTIGS